MLYKNYVAQNGLRFMAMLSPLRDDMTVDRHATPHVPVSWDPPNKITIEPVTNTNTLGFIDYKIAHSDHNPTHCCSK